MYCAGSLGDTVSWTCRWLIGFRWRVQAESIIANASETHLHLHSVQSHDKALAVFESSRKSSLGWRGLAMNKIRERNRGEFRSVAVLQQLGQLP